MDTTAIREYQKIATYLLEKHFGLTLNDTNLHDDAVVQELVELNVPVFEAINQLVDKYHLDRIDQNAWSPRSPLLTPSNFMIAVLELVPEKVQLVRIDETDEKLMQH
ncbi:Toxin YkfI [Serratia fonticola]|uniref:toxin n=1 Tax=Serratia fonticola TaxID=47917 RepID=UPI00218263BF|nr:toxin [Serratia fonticola]CAI2039927.1 Toxin YkfI [Serratia fonticola]